MPPEIVNHQKYDLKVDIWSAGCVAYVMMTGKPPFFGSTKDEVYTAIKETEPDIDKNLASVSENARNFIKATLVKDPEKRLSAFDALQHPWLVDVDLYQNQDGPKLENVVQNLGNFCQMNNFKKMVISIVASL